MKIVDRKTFLSLPAGTLYIKYTPQYFHEYLCIKESGANEFNNDWCFTALFGDLDVKSSEELGDKLDYYTETGETFRFDFDNNCMRDGRFDEDQLFAVYDKEDIKMLINKLLELMGKMTDG